MNRHTVLLSFSVISASLLVTSCTKQDDEPATPSTNTPSNTSPTPAPSFPGSAGVLWAVNTITSQTIAGFPIEIETGVGLALFPTEGSSTTYVDAGTVSLNDAALSRQTNNTYVSTPTQTAPTGIDFSSGQTHWTVSGGNGIPSIDQDPSFLFPSVGELTSSTTVTRSNGYTLVATDISACDSIAFSVGSVLKMKPSGTTSCTFTAAELSAIAAGPSIVQVSPYKYNMVTLAGKQFYFGKQTSRSWGVTIQ